jgi:predicted Zn-dependent protease
MMPRTAASDVPLSSRYNELITDTRTTVFSMSKGLMMMIKKLLLVFVPLLLFGCAVNPVTGKSELALVPESTELNVGAEQYAPSRQMQGGDYTTEPAITEYVSSVGNRLAAVSDRKLPYEFKVINDSTPNAWALPGGKIAVNRGLLTELQSEAELAAVLGHEIVHAAARHGAKGMERGLLMQGAVLAVGIASSNSEYGQMALGGASLAAGLIGQKYSRDAERESDYYGMQYMSRAGYDPRAAVSLQETFVRLSEGRNQDWLSGLFSSHPPSMERVAANRQTAQSLPAGGEVGRERYQQKMAPLMAAKEAYKAYDDGRKALAKGETDQALALVQKALNAHPEEALFHSLRGDVRFKQGQFQDAVTNYDRALQRNPDYFHYFLQRGLARQKLGDLDAAYADLEQSIKKLPTAIALNALGNISLTRGNLEQAKQFFASAAESQTEPGQAAATSLARLELPDNPGKYLKIQVGRSKQGDLLAQVSNTTNLTVADVEFILVYRDATGTQQKRALRVPGPLGPQKSIIIATGIGAGEQIRDLQTGVTGARLVE